MDLFLILHVVVYQTPLLQKPMDTENSTHVARQVSTATRHREILGRVESETVNHKVPIRQVAAWRENGEQEERQLLHIT